MGKEKEVKMKDKNAVSSFIDYEEDKEQVEKAVDRFSFKAFYKKWQALQKTAKVLTILLPSLSITTSSLWLGSVLSSILPIFWLVVFFGFALIIALEYIKNHFLKVGFTDFYGSIKYAWLIVLSAMSLACVSGYVSLQGIADLHAQTNQTLQTIAEVQGNEKDSISKKFEAKLESLDGQISALNTLQTNTQKRKWGLLPHEAKALLNLQKERQSIRESKDKELQKLSQEQKQVFSVEQSNVGFNQTVIIVIIAVVEVLIVLSSWFLIYFDYRTKKESQTIAKATNTIHVNSHDFGQMVRQYFLSIGQDLSSIGQDLPQETRVLGFQNLKQDLKENPNDLKKSKKQDLNNKHSQDLQDLIAEIKAGQRHRPSLAKKYKVNIPMINKLIKEYG